MNRILGFFKQKIIEAKQQNKQQLQVLANALSENEYSTEKVLTLLQSMKANYMNWNILIANEASNGLYYSQLHNRNICLKKIKSNEEIRRQLERNRTKLRYVRETAESVREISGLNGDWASNVNKGIQGFEQYLQWREQRVPLQAQGDVEKVEKQAEVLQVQKKSQETQGENTRNQSTPSAINQTGSAVTQNKQQIPDEQP